MKYYLSTLAVLLFISCNSDDGEGDIECGPPVIISTDFDTVETDPYSVGSVSLADACLEIVVVSGGCDGESWTAEMYAAEVITQEFPPTVPLKLSLTDLEDCEALVQRPFYFDLTSLIEVYPQFRLSIEGYEVLIEYPQ